MCGAETRLGGEAARVVRCRFSPKSARLMNGKVNEADFDVTVLGIACN